MMGDLFPDAPRASVPHDPLDRHYTPQALADAIVQRLWRRGALGTDSHVVEPSAGGGAFVRAALRAGVASVTAIDVDPDAAGLALATLACPGADWLSLAPDVEADVVVGNPPFGGPPDYLGLQHALAAVSVARFAVALILPWSWLGTPTPRRMLGERPPSEVWPIGRRPWPRSVRETAVWVWEVGCEGPTAIGEPIEWGF